MAFTRVAALLHAALSDVTAAQHHTATVASALNHQDLSARGVADHHAATVAADLALSDLATRAHADLSDAPADAHHAGAHQAAHDAGGADPIAQMCHVATGTYTGDGATSQAITGLGFAPLLVYISRRFTTASNYDDREIGFTSDVIVDDNASGTSVVIEGNTAGRTQSAENSIIALGADGFSVDDNGSDQDPNQNTTVYNFWAIG